MKRPAYLLVVRPEPGVDDICALRGWLKVGLRHFGLKCLGVTPKHGDVTMDAREYASTFVRPDDVRDEPIRTRILNVFEGERFKRLVLELETGQQFGLNDGNTNTLIKAWGHDTDKWISLELELYLGTYKDWNEDPPAEKETVRVKAISPRPGAQQNGATPQSKPPLPPSLTATSQKDLDDEIPF
jgi:hypothetical protein